MNPSYLTEYKTKNIKERILKKNILDLYPNNVKNNVYNYDEILFILDQNCNNKCDRDVAM